MKLLLLWLYVFGVMVNFFLKGSIILGLSMAWSSFVVSLSLMKLMKSWFSVIFFLVFISGLLVLMIYVLSMDYKPFFISKIKFKLLLFCLVYSSWNVMFFCKKKIFLDKFSKELFVGEEFFFVVFLSVYLLFILWAVVKMVFNKKSKFRPLFS